MTDWMVSRIEGMTPKLLFRQGRFMFDEAEAREFLKELRTKYPAVTFHLSRDGHIVSEELK